MRGCSCRACSSVPGCSPANGGPMRATGLPGGNDLRPSASGHTGRRSAACNRCSSASSSPCRPTQECGIGQVVARADDGAPQVYLAGGDQQTLGGLEVAHRHTFAVHAHAHAQRGQIVHGLGAVAAQGRAQQTDHAGLARLELRVALVETAGRAPALHGAGQSQQQRGHAQASAGAAGAAAGSTGWTWSRSHCCKAARLPWCVPSSAGQAPVASSTPQRSRSSP